MSYWKEIYSYDELNALIVDGVITQSIWVQSTLVNRLSGVKEIRTGGQGIVFFRNLVDIGELECVDCDFIFSGNLISLNNLQYVGGKLEIAAPLKSLGNLKEVKKDLRLQCNDLEDLGSLITVGGTLDLRGMVNIRDLGKLEYVGENLNLVKSLKKEYNLSGIKVMGRIIYWNKQPTFYQAQSWHESEVIPPVWSDLRTCEFENDLVIMEPRQREFYEYFKKSFFERKFLDIGGFKNYLMMLIYEIRNKFIRDQNFDELKNNYRLIKDYYPFITPHCDSIEINLGRGLGIEKYENVVLPHEEYIIWKKQLKNAISIQPPQFTLDDEAENDLAELFYIGFKKNNLTPYGQSNLEEIINQTITLIRNRENSNKTSFARRFITKGKYHKFSESNTDFDSNAYREFFDSDEEFNFYLTEHEKRMLGVPLVNIINPITFPPIVQFAIIKDFSRTMREAENFVRISKGIPKIGEGWVNETELFNRIQAAYSKCKVIHHGRVKWLGQQHFDIYFPELNIAIEYQGAQHYEEIEIFGGAEGLTRTRENDRLKKEKCEKNQCILIEVFPNYDFNLVRQEIDDAIRKQLL
jgi:hypothetical protein